MCLQKCLKKYLIRIMVDQAVGSKHTFRKPNSRRFIILHHTNPSDRVFKELLHKTTGMTGIKGLLKFLSDMPRSSEYGRISYHSVCDRDGQGYELVDEAYDSWAAGKSVAVDHTITEPYQTKIVHNLNDQAIQLALIGDGNKFGFESVQYDWAARKCAHYVTKYNIDPRRILGHEDIGIPIGRKHDPGKLFDWHLLFAKMYAILKIA